MVTIKRILIISFATGVALLPTAKAEDLSASAYASVSAKRLLVSFHKNANGSREKQELDRQWRSLERWDANHNDVLSAEEMAIAHFR